MYFVQVWTGMRTDFKAHMEFGSDLGFGFLGSWIPPEKPKINHKRAELGFRLGLGLSSTDIWFICISTSRALACAWSHINGLHVLTWSSRTQAESSWGGINSNLSHELIDLSSWLSWFAHKASFSPSPTEMISYPQPKVLGTFDLWCWGLISPKE